MARMMEALRKMNIDAGKSESRPIPRAVMALGKSWTSERARHSPHPQGDLINELSEL